MSILPHVSPRSILNCSRISYLATVHLLAVICVGPGKDLFSRKFRESGNVSHQALLSEQLSQRRSTLKATIAFNKCPVYTFPGFVGCIMDWAGIDPLLKATIASRQVPCLYVSQVSSGAVMDWLGGFRPPLQYVVLVRIGPGEDLLYGQQMKRFPTFRTPRFSASNRAIEEPPERPRISPSLRAWSIPFHVSSGAS